MRPFKQFAALLATVCCFQFVNANTIDENLDKNSVEGSVHGYILDAVTKRPVTGVTVSISLNKSGVGSTSKTPGAKEIQSDATGHFHISKLPAGEVTLIFEKKGYKLFKRDMTGIKEGKSSRISVEVQPVSQSDGGNEIWHPFLKFLD